LRLERYDGMLNIGWRPTVKGKKRTIEAHFFDFNEDIYGSYLRVELVSFIRKEIEFNHLDSLKEQLIKDKSAAKIILEKVN
jgi:riboflavin kinase/FMN adenylyltransferase